MALMPASQSARIGRQFPQNSEINVTPFVDIMLVLLIVFMVAAPILTSAILVEIPPTDSTHTPPKLVEPVIVSMSASGEIFIARGAGTQMQCAWSEVPNCLRSLTSGNLAERIHVQVSQDVKYGEAVRLMDVIRDDGYKTIALIGEDAETPPPFE